MSNVDYKKHYEEFMNCKSDTKYTILIKKLLITLPDFILIPLLDAAGDISSARYYAELEYKTEQCGDNNVTVCFCDGDDEQIQMDSK